MLKNHILNKITINCLGLLVLSIFAPQAQAGRYVLNQTPQKIQNYFGRPIAREQSNASTTYTYSAKPLRLVIPKLPKQAKFEISFIQNKAQVIALIVHAQEKSFNYGQAEAQELFNYIFGYKPPIWKPIPLPFGGGGHEGFRDHKFCLGDGVVNNFISYRIGEEFIQLRYDPACESRNPNHFKISKYRLKLLKRQLPRPLPPLESRGDLGEGAGGWSFRINYVVYLMRLSLITYYQ